jgi:hypothetical protein
VLGSRRKTKHTISLQVFITKVEKRPPQILQYTMKGIINFTIIAECWWLTPVTLATQDRYQEDEGSKPALGKEVERPYLKLPNIKKDWWSGSSGKATA